MSPKSAFQWHRPRIEFRVTDCFICAARSSSLSGKYIPPIFAIKHMSDFEQASGNGIETEDAARARPYGGELQAAADALLRRYGASETIRKLDELLAECHQKTHADALDMAMMWQRVRDLIIDGV
jgi:hypothetical protein